MSQMVGPSKLPNQIKIAPNWSVPVLLCIVIRVWEFLKISVIALWEGEKAKWNHPSAQFQKRMRYKHEAMGIDQHKE